MKRSRYSATMSRWSGSSNQSRERKRRAGRVESDAMRDLALRQARYVNPNAEQSARERLLRALPRAESPSTRW